MTQDRPRNHLFSKKIGIHKNKSLDRPLTSPDNRHQTAAHRSWHTGADTMTTQEQKQIDRATAQGRGALLRTLAITHRAGSSRTQKEIIAMIDEACAHDEFTMVNGALLHNSEI
jgi:hypothetical protein